MPENLDSELLSEIEIINSQPLEQRAEGFERVYEKFVGILKHSDESHD